MIKMKKNILLTGLVLMSVLACTQMVNAQPQVNENPQQSQQNYRHAMPHDPKIREERAKKFDEILAQRLSLTQEQKDAIEKSRKKTRKELEKIYDAMKKEQKKIRDVYMTGIPAYQANIRTSASKAKLAVLKQKADSIREESRKNFEKILTPEQKAEFEKFRQEMSEKRKEMSEKRKEKHFKKNKMD